MSTVYEIRDVDGTVVALHERIAKRDGGKVFTWRLPGAAETGLQGLPVRDLPLYGIHRLESPTVVLVEGEKCAEALWSLRIPTVATVCGAASSPSPRILSELAGKVIYLWPDADDIGRQHMERIATDLARIAASVRWISPPEDAPKGWDAADAVALPDGEALVRALIEQAAQPAAAPAGGPGEEAPEDRRRRLDIIRGIDVQPLAVSWLWCRYLPLGMLSLFDGDPGLGKSTVVYDIAARVTTGRQMPDGSPGVLGDVLVFSAEDAIEYVIVPRLIAAGADMARVRIVRGSRSPGDDEAVAVTLPEDLEAIRDALDGVALAIIDPLMAYLGGEVNSHRDQDIRRVLAVLSRMAEDTGAAFVIVRHLNKAAGSSALYRGGGSIGIIGAARAAYIFGRDPDDETLVLMASNKINVGMKPETMAFRLVDAPLPEHPGVSVARVEWEGTSDHGAEDIIRPRSEDERNDGGEAGAFLREILADGPVPTSDIKDAASGHGIAWRTIERAKSTIGIVARKTGRPGEAGQRWEWSLPEDRHENPKTATSDGWRSSPPDGGLRAEPAPGPTSASPVCAICHRPKAQIPGTPTTVCTNPACPPRAARSCPACHHQHPAGTSCSACPECVGSIAA